MEIYDPDKWFKVFNTVEYSIQPGYYENVQDVTDALLKAGIVHLTDVVVAYGDTSKRVTTKCVKGAPLALKGEYKRGYIARMFGFLNNTMIRTSDKKVSSFPYLKLEINIYTEIIKS